VSVIEKMRARYGQRLPELFEGRFALARNETVRLQAIRELLDRLIGRATQVVETQHTRIDVAGMYFAALQRSGAAAKTVDGKRADDDGLPFTLINGLKYRPVRRGQEWLRSRIKTLGQAKLRRRR
jgi:hypothetical protein